jgi:biotin-dependent carboxylase-like uncharacterized protein
MHEEVFEILEPGLGASLQDRGRIGWRRFGVPASGAMDDHAMHWANCLLGNSLDAPVLEVLLQGARLRAVRSARIAITGADAQASVPTWRSVCVSSGDIIEFPQSHSGVWSYLAIEGGFEGERILGSFSAYPRAGLGRPITSGQKLRWSPDAVSQWPHSVAGRLLDGRERRRYDQPPVVRVWRGPQWNLFDHAVRENFFAQEWAVSSQSDRVGYRLRGEPLRAPSIQIVSEAVLVGSIQIPSNGEPIVTMRDGPTVGGYPKLGLVDPADVSWLAQCRPGAGVRFRMVEHAS